MDQIGIVDRLYRLTTGNPTAEDGAWLTDQLMLLYTGKNCSLSNAGNECKAYWKQQRYDAAYDLIDHLASIDPSSPSTVTAQQIILYQQYPPTHDETLELYEQYEDIASVIGFYSKSRLAELARDIQDKDR